MSLYVTSLSSCPSRANSLSQIKSVVDCIIALGYEPCHEKTGICTFVVFILKWGLAETASPSEPSFCMRTEFCSWSHTKRRLGQASASQTFFLYVSGKDFKTCFCMTRLILDKVSIVTWNAEGVLKSFSWLYDVKCNVWTKWSCPTTRVYHVYCFLIMVSSPWFWSWGFLICRKGSGTLMAML